MNKVFLDWLGRGGPERRRLHLGYVPSLDAAPFFVAQARHYFAEEGLEVELHQFSAWRHVCEGLSGRKLDAALLPLSIPLSASLGLREGINPMRSAFVASRNGGGFGISPNLAEQIDKFHDCSGALEKGQLLASYVRGQVRHKRLRFLVSAYDSVESFELRYWLAGVGIDPVKDVEIHALSAGRLKRAISEGRYDGAYLDEPFYSAALEQGEIQPLFDKYSFWNHSPNKVVAVDQRWLQKYPRTHLALVKALIKAAHWLEFNRGRAAELLAESQYLDVPKELIEKCLQPSAQPAQGINYASGCANFPWYSQAVWYLGQMIRWGDYSEVLDFKKTAQAVYLPKLYREAARELSLPYPSIGYKTEGVHGQDWDLEEASEALQMHADQFFDGRMYKPRQTMKYLNGFDLNYIRAPLDAMWAIR